MIDLERMESQLEMALTQGRARPEAPAVASPRRRRRAAVPAPPAAAPAGAEPGRSPSVGELLELGLVEQADARIAAGPAEGRDATTWSTMRALLDGRRDAVTAGLDAMRELATATADADTWDRYWAQRFWAAFEWGDDGERYDVLDHCRERAYRFDDLQWWGSLTLLLAELGKGGEAVRAFDEAYRLLARAQKDSVRIDVLTDVLEAAVTLGDWERAGLASRSLDWPPGRLVVVGPGVVCKGSVERYRALGLAATGRWAEARACFRLAAEAHRAIGARTLLDRTHRQAERFERAA